MHNVLITGIAGSAGSYLAEYLDTSTDSIVHGTTRKLSDSHYKLHQCDLSDLSSVCRVLERVDPKYIFNLAANADVKYSFDNPIATIHNNVDATLNLLEGIRLTKINPILQHCSTSEVYGMIKKEDCPVDENHKIQPANVYAISKCTQEQLVLAYSKMYNIDVVVTRAFGYINPRRNNIFSTAFANQIAKLENGGGILRHGNLDSVRTLMDVRDIARAYYSVSTIGRTGEIYNIGSTSPISVKEFLDELLRISGSTNISLFEDPTLLRPVDVTLQIPNVSKFERHTEFKSEFSLEQSIEWLLEECRKNVHR
jgi:GDP-4-dehydro-6-deoxy-D-mannose reductase